MTPEDLLQYYSKQELKSILKTERMSAILRRKSLTWEELTALDRIIAAPPFKEPDPLEHLELTLTETGMRVKNLNTGRSKTFYPLESGHPNKDPRVKFWDCILYYHHWLDNPRRANHGPLTQGDWEHFNSWRKRWTTARDALVDLIGQELVDYLKELHPPLNFDKDKPEPEPAPRPTSISTLIDKL